MANFLTRQQIKEACKSVLGLPFYVEEWSGDIYIKKWNGLERAEFITKVQTIYAESEDETSDKPKDIMALFNFQTEVVALSLYGEDGLAMYDYTNPDDLKEVNNFEADLLQKLFAECAVRNGLTDGQLGKDIKNSETAQSSDSI